MLTELLLVIYSLLADDTFTKIMKFKTGFRDQWKKPFLEDCSKENESESPAHEKEKETIQAEEVKKKDVLVQLCESNLDPRVVHPRRLPVFLHNALHPTRIPISRMALPLRNTRRRSRRKRIDHGTHHPLRCQPS